MTIKEALKKLFKSKGGDPASIKGQGIADIIDAMAGGKSSGDGSTGGVLVINVTVKDGDVISDKSFAEVETAINNGKAVLLCVHGEVYMSNYLVNTDDSQDVRYARFYNFSIDGMSADSQPILTYEEFRLGSESNVLIFDSQDFTLTPFV